MHGRWSATSRWSGAACAIALAWTGAAGAVEGGPVAGPRPISEAERQGAALATLYFERGAEGWWEMLSADSPLRALPHDEAVAELSVRAGPAQGAVWTLQMTPARYPEGTVIFAVEYPSGVEDALFLELVEEGGAWRIRQLRCLVDPSSLKEPLPAFLRLERRTASLFVLPDPGPSGSTLAGALLLSGLAVLLFLFRNRRRAVVAGLALAVASGLACNGGDGGAGGAAAGAPARLGALMPLRQLLAGAADGDPLEAVRALPKESPAFAAARLWQAQALLAKSQLNPVEKILSGFPTPAELPLTGLLRARLALLRSDVGGTFEAFDQLLSELADDEELRQEAAEAFLLLGLEREAGELLARLADAGSRQADVYYYLAQLAVLDDRMEDAGAFLRRGWELVPLERRRLFAEPLLARLAASPALYDSFHFGSAAEPSVEPSAVERRPVELAEDVPCTLLGSELTVEAGGATWVAPGGTALAPARCRVENAVERAARQRSRALERVAEIAGSTAKQAALAQPRLRRVVETAVGALAWQRRWQEVVELTDGLWEAVDSAPPTLVRLRARALLETERLGEARELVVLLAQNDVANRRRDPGTFYDLAELLAAGGDYSRAIRALEKASALSPSAGAAQRIRQLRLEEELATSYQEHATAHFTLRYPRTTHRKYAEALGQVLEAERQRLARWIPLTPGAEKVEVHLFPLRQFLTSYSTGVIVVGLFDGKVRVPFADLESLGPAIVSILTHELAHALITQRTDDRAPKWLQEGLAQHVQMVQDFLNPVPDLVAADRLVAFPILETVLAGFAEAQLVELAYSEAAWVVHFIEARYGPAGLHRLLAAFADGEGTEEAIRTAFRVTPEAFEREAWRWCRTAAPVRWPTEVRRYDREIDPYLGRGIATPEAKPPPARRPTAAERMATWHRGYQGRVAGVRRALGGVVRGLRGGGAGSVDVSACLDLGRAVAEAQGDPSPFAAPDEGVGEALTEAYAGLGRVAETCRRGRTEEALAELDAAERHLARAARLLEPYGLRP